MRFYVGTLGFRELQDRNGVGLAILVRDQVEVHLWVANGSAPAPNGTWPARPLAEYASRASGTSTGSASRCVWCILAHH